MRSEAVTAASSAATACKAGTSSLPRFRQNRRHPPLPHRNGELPDGPWSSRIKDSRRA